MMETQAGFIFKVIVVSAVLSFLIKYGGSPLNLEPTAVNVLAIVFAPTVILAIALLWRWWQQQPN